MIDWLRTITSFESVGAGVQGARRRRFLRLAVFAFGFAVNLALWYGVGRLVEGRVR